MCDLYLRLAEEPRLYSPRWTSEILEEVRRTHIQKLGWEERLADYWREQVTKSFPEALVEGYEPFIAQCTNHPKDRHVLAAAIRVPANAIITFNLKDFPAASLTPHSVVAHHPADYLCTLFDRDSAIVTARIFEIAEKRKIPPQELLRRMNKPLSRFAVYFAGKQGWSILREEKQNYFYKSLVKSVYF